MSIIIFHGFICGGVVSLSVYSHLLPSSRIEFPLLLFFGAVMDLFFLENVFSVFSRALGEVQLPLACHLDTVIHSLQIFFSELYECHYYHL